VPRIDIAAVPVRKGSGYPPPFDAACAPRTRRRLGEAGGLRDFGVNLMTLPPGGWSSQRHWHSDEDEFVYVLEGVVTLIEDGGETELHAGDCATFPKEVSRGLGAADARSLARLRVEALQNDRRAPRSSGVTRALEQTRKLGRPPALRHGEWCVAVLIGDVGTSAGGE
jgi:quercetin dioxygenase-like cupin family protein